MDANNLRDIQVGLILGQTGQIAVEIAQSGDIEGAKLGGSKAILGGIGKVLGPVAGIFNTLSSVSDGLKNTKFGKTLNDANIDISQPLLNLAYMSTSYGLGRFINIKHSRIPFTSYNMTFNEWALSILLTNSFNVVEKAISEEIKGQASTILGVSLPVQAVGFTSLSKFII